MDLYTHTGETVEPIPYSDIPSEHAKNLHKNYNTRYLSGGL